MKKVDILSFSTGSTAQPVEKQVEFTIDGEDFSSDVLVKRLSYDESVGITRGKNLDKLLMADLVKMRILATIYNKDTQQPLFASLDEVGKSAPQIMDALHRASDDVNDYVGKQQRKHLKKMNSGANLSSTELADAQ